MNSKTAAQPKDGGPRCSRPGRASLLGHLSQAGGRTGVCPSGGAGETSARPFYDHRFGLGSCMPRKKAPASEGTGAKVSLHNPQTSKDQRGPRIGSK